MAQNPFADINLATATDEQLSRMKAATDDDLLRAAGTPDLFAVVESSRRLRVALQKEERAIKRLTWVLVFFTLILIALGVEEVLRRHGIFL
jgi:hypothetical protein